jgi:hypothetical protein
MIRSVIATIKNSYKLLCKQESDNLWCWGKLLISIRRAMNSSRIELLWLVWDQSQSKYYLRTKFQDGIDKPQKCWNVCYHPTHQQQSDFLILVLYDFTVQNILSSLLLLCYNFMIMNDYEWIINTVFILHSSYKTLLIRQKCKQYILKWDAVGSILK